MREKRKAWGFDAYTPTKGTWCVHALGQTVALIDFDPTPPVGKVHPLSGSIFLRALKLRLCVRLCRLFVVVQVIHVGELFGDSVSMRPGQSPWGRTTSQECQEELASKFHCILKVRFLVVRFALASPQRGQLANNRVGLLWVEFERSLKYHA